MRIEEAHKRILDARLGQHAANARYTDVVSRFNKFMEKNFQVEPRPLPPWVASPELEAELSAAQDAAIAAETQFYAVLDAALKEPSNDDATV